MSQFNMASNNVGNYVRDPKKSFFSLEDDDVDDDEFLKNSRATSYTPFSTSSNNTPPIDLDKRRQQLIERKREIEERTVASTERSLGLLIESKQVGIETAEELARQREQLERTEKSLDNINTTLRFTQRNIESVKSVFGSLKNYLTKRGDQPPGIGTSKANDNSPINPIDRSSEQIEHIRSLSSPHDHPAMRIRGFADEKPLSYRQQTADQRLEHNLQLMGDNIGTLKGLAVSLGDEIVSQNELVGNIMDKTDRADFTLHKQNKEISNILKK